MTNGIVALEAASTGPGASWAVHFGEQVSRFVSNCVRYSCASRTRRRQVLARRAAALPPCEFPTNRLFLRLKTTRFFSCSETMLSIPTAPSRGSGRDFTSG